MNTLNTRPPKIHANIRSVSCSFIGYFQLRANRPCRDLTLVHGSWFREDEGGAPLFFGEENARPQQGGVIAGV
jgi:hypothetical protein